MRSLRFFGYDTASSIAANSPTFGSLVLGLGYARTRRFSELAGLAPLASSPRFGAAEFITASH